MQYLLFLVSIILTFEIARYFNLKKSIKKVFFNFYNLGVDINKNYKKILNNETLFIKILKKFFIDILKILLIFTTYIFLILFINVIDNNFLKLFFSFEGMIFFLLIFLIYGYLRNNKN